MQILLCQHTCIGSGIIRIESDQDLGARNVKPSPEIEARCGPARGQMIEDDQCLGCFFRGPSRAGTTPDRASVRSLPAS